MINGKKVAVILPANIADQELDPRLQHAAVPEKRALRLAVAVAEIA